MRSDGRLGRVIGGFLVVVHMEISTKKRASYTEALEIIKKTIVGLLSKKGIHNFWLLIGSHTFIQLKNLCLFNGIRNQFWLIPNFLGLGFGQ